MNALGDAPRVTVVSDPEAAAQLAGEHIAASLARAALGDGDGAPRDVHFVTTGGSAAPPLYRAMAGEALRDIVPWPGLHVWWGDDRFVPRDHPLSNIKSFDELLRDAVPLDPAHVHPIRTTEAIATERDPAWAAAALDADLRAAGLPTEDGLPVLDLVVLGVGGDGHMLSVFPGSEALAAPRDQWAMAIPAPTHIEPHVERVTMHPGIVAVARDVLAVVTGESKAAMVAEVFGPTRDTSRWPVQLTLHTRATWILDEAAAARLPR